MTTPTPRIELREWLSQCAAHRPTPAQYEAFAYHICEDHSWYKGSFAWERPFAVTIVPEILKAESAQAESAHNQFGCLHYMHSWRDEDELLRFPKEVVERCSFGLYPYVSAKFLGSDNPLDWHRHQREMEDMRTGKLSLDCDDAIKFFRLYDEEKALKAALPPAEATMAWTLEYGSPRLAYLLGPPIELASVPPGVRECVRVYRRYAMTWFALRNKELGKIRRALANLDQILQLG